MRRGQLMPEQKCFQFSLKRSVAHVSSCTMADGASSSETLVAVRIVCAWYEASPVNCWSEKATATVSDEVDIVS